VTEAADLGPQRAEGRFGIATTFAFIIVAVSLVAPASPGAQLVSTVGLILLPGLLLTSLIVPWGITGLRKLLLATGIGITLFCFVGAAAGAIGPYLGVSRPLSRVPLLVVWLVLLAMLAAVAVVRRADPVGDLLAGHPRRSLWWIAALAVPPCIALVGATELNATSSNTIATTATVLGLGLVFASVAFSRRIGEGLQAGFVGSAVVTLVWQIPTRGGWLWGWDIQHEFSVAAATIAAGRFPIPHSHDPYAGMLSLTVLPAQLHFLNAIQLRTILVLVPGVLLAACAVTTLLTIRRILGPTGSALLVALLIVGTTSFLTELPALMRQCVALFLFTVVIQLVSDPTAPIRRVRVLAAVLGLGLAVSHYSTAYMSAAAVVVAWLFGLVLRAHWSRRVLTAPVAASFAGAALIWGLVVANTGSYLGQVFDAIRTSGLELFPGTGNLLSRWIEGAASSERLSASRVRALDLVTRTTHYTWMNVDPRANSTVLVNKFLPTSRGVPVFGSIVDDGATVARELLLVLIVVAVLWIVWRAFRGHQHVEIAGLAVFGGIASALSRSSGTLVVQFNADRVEAQMYLVFVVAAAYLFQRVRPRIPRMAPWLLGLIATLQVASACGVTSYVIANSNLPVSLAATGSQVEDLAVTPADKAAAQWLVANSGARLIQTDPFSVLALDDFDGGYRRSLIQEVDPVIVDNSAWILAIRANVVNHVARVISGRFSGEYAFPSAYFGGTRSILYVSRSDIVYGSDPS